MPALLRTTQIQEPSSASVNLTLDTSGNGTFAGTAVMSSPYTMRNKIINGAMMIDQRNAGASVTPTANLTYTLDRWVSVLTAASKYSVQQNAGSVTPPTGFTNYLGVTSLSAYSIAAGDLFSVNQRIEGFNAADLAWGAASAQTVTLSFWVRSSLTGTFGGCINNSAANRTYLFTYTISAANTWEQKTIAIAGDTTGTWLTTSGIGVEVRFGLGAGSTYTGTANTWSSSAVYQPTGSVNLVATNGATFYITGVQLERGTVATPFEYRPYGIEMGMCQRYYWRITGASTGTFPGIGSGVATGATTSRIYIKHPVQMRAAATYSYGGNISVYDGTGNPVVSAISATYAGLDTSMLDLTNGSGLTLGRGVVANVQSTSADYIQASAEL